MIDALETPVLPGLSGNGAASACASQMTTCVRRHPGGALLAAAGLGLVAALLIRAFNPPPPRHRAALLLEEIQQRLADLAHPAYDRVSQLVEHGAHAVSRRADRKFGAFGREFKRLFH